MTEKLYTCPWCNRPNFTLPGLRGHTCKDGQRPTKEQIKTVLAVVKPKEMQLAVATTVEIVAAPGASKEFDQARFFLKMAQVSMAKGAAFMVMTGIELQRLHKLHAIKPGKPSANSRNVSGIKWPELVKQEMGISDDTAANYMKMAEGAKKRLPGFDAEELLNTPLAQLPDTRREKLIKSVQKLTDGQTAQQLMSDWGIVKKPHGAGLRSSAHGDKGGRRGKMSAEEQEAVENEAAKADRDALVTASAQVLDEKSWLRWSSEKAEDRKALTTLKGNLVDILAHLKNI